MELQRFMATLMPTFTKNDILDELKATEESINSFLPILQQAQRRLNRFTFKHEFVERLEERLIREAKLKRQPNFMMMFLELVEKMEKQIPVIEKLVHDKFESDVTVHAMNLHRINVLQYIPIMLFTIQYMRSFTNIALSLEINTASDSETAVYEIIEADTSWLSANRSTFVDACRIMNRKSDDLEKVFEDLPEMDVDPHNVKVVEATKHVAIDPMAMGLIPITINPFFHFQRIIVEWQVQRYHSMKTECELLERKVHNLNLINDGKNDPKLQQQAKYIEEERLRPLKQEIAKMEQKYVHQ